MCEGGGGGRRRGGGEVEGVGGEGASTGRSTDGGAGPRAHCVHTCPAVAPHVASACSGTTVSDTLQPAKRAARISSRPICMRSDSNVRKLARVAAAPSRMVCGRLGAVRASVAASSEPRSSVSGSSQKSGADASRTVPIRTNGSATPPRSASRPPSMGPPANARSPIAWVVPSRRPVCSG